jgi:quercetin dioxygenase-like cupin family protein
MLENMRTTLRLVVLFGMSAVCVGHAEQAAAPQAPAPAGQSTPAAPAPARGVLAEAPGFTGRTATLDATGYTIGRRVFEAGGHNATWHMHAAGQLVFAESGRGRLQIKGQPIRELSLGDSAYIPGGTMHWHGAAPNENFTMTFVTMGASTTTQGEAVTEDVYLGKK